MKKRVVKIFALVVFLALTTESVLAYNPLLGGKLINGVGNVCYTVNGGAADYSWYINDAAYNWEHTGWDNPIYMTAVSSSYGSTIDFYSRADGNNDVLAYTIFFNASGNQQSYTSNYLYSQIWINSSIIGNYNIGGTMRHEIGHAFGMNENNGNAYSIMSQTWKRQVQTVQKVDNDTINYLY
ncbi:MAG: hypothetical protein RR646_02125 [Erysipelotrichaceae bacterium]